jgi:hypothetical protein
MAWKWTKMDISRLSRPSGDLPIQPHFVPRRRLGPRPAPSSLADVAKGGDGAESAWILAPSSSLSGRRGSNMAGSAATFLHEPLFAKTG